MKISFVWLVPGSYSYKLRENGFENPPPHPAFVYGGSQHNTCIKQSPAKSPASDSDMLLARVRASVLDCGFQTVARRGKLLGPADLY